MSYSLQDLRKIDPANEAIRFLEQRIVRDDYRGLQISQHNRYNREFVVDMLKIMHDLVGSDAMQIRTTDLSRRPYNEIGEENYAEYVNRVNRKLGRGTQDSVRKNLFVDFHRMGFIERYNKNMERNVAGKRSKTKFVALTDIGEKIVQADLFQQNLLYTEAINQLFGNQNQTIFDIVLELSPQKLTIEEMMYFVSFLGKNYEGETLEKSEIIELIREYRRLSAAQKRHLNEIVQEICDPNIFHSDKIEQRDYHNWRNESQQIFMLLSQTVYFEANFDNSELKPRTQNGIFDEAKLIRSQTEKKSYFAEHKIQEKRGFVLHHIVPLFFSDNQNEYFLHDKWQNMIYINGTNHNIIHQEHTKHIIVDFYDNFLCLKSYSDEYLRLENKKDVIFSAENRTVMLNYNSQLLEKG